MAVAVPEAVRRLGVASQDGLLAALCERQGIELMVLFGSAARFDEDRADEDRADVDRACVPRDIDLAVWSRTDGLDQLGVHHALWELVGTEDVDLMDLRRAGPVARERALVGAVVLHEGERGLFANQQIAAIMERMDTAWLRRLELELLRQ